MDRTMSQKVLGRARREQGLDRQVWMHDSTYALLRGAFECRSRRWRDATFPEFVDAVVRRGLRRKKK